MLKSFPKVFCPYYQAASLSALPKRPSNAYIHYVSENFPNIKSKQPPNTAGKDIMRILGEDWKTLPEPRKAVYKQRAVVEATKYENFFKTAPLDLLFEAEDKKEKKFMMKKFEELGRLPKRPPMSGYALFISRQKGNSKLSAPENMKLFAEKYQKLSDFQKGRLNDDVRIMKERYEKQMHQIFNP